MCFTGERLSLNLWYSHQHTCIGEHSFACRLRRGYGCLLVPAHLWKLSQQMGQACCCFICPGSPALHPAPDHCCVLGSLCDGIASECGAPAGISLSVDSKMRQE